MGTNYSKILTILIFYVTRKIMFPLSTIARQIFLQCVAAIYPVVIAKGPVELNFLPCIRNDVNGNVLPCSISTFQ